jgi:hypothetical protein
MVSPPVTDLTRDVRVLMSPEDELSWQHEGLLLKADSLSGSPGTFNLNSCTLNHNTGFDVPPQILAPRVSLLLETFPSINPPSFPSMDASSKIPNSVPKVDTATKSGYKGGGQSISFRNSKIPTNWTGVRRRVWKPNKRIRRMVLGLDVGLEETCRLAMCGLVGRLSYSYLVDSPVRGWITKSWVPILGYEPEMFVLTKGWMGFVCKTPEDADLLLNKFWVIGGNTLMLKRWRVAFDPCTEYFQYRYLWILLPGFPLDMWNEGALRAIGEALG